MAQDRQTGTVRVGVATAESVDRRGDRVLMSQRQQGHRHPDHGPDLRAPEACAGDDQIGADGVLLHTRADAYPGDATAGLLDPDHLGAAVEDHAGAPTASDQQLHRARREREPVGGRVVATEELVAVQQGVQAYALLRIDQAGVDPPGLGPAELALQIGPPGGRGGHLQTTDLIEAGAAVGRHVQQLLHGVAGEQGHGAGRVGLEHQSRSVGGGATGGGQRTLLDDGDVGPATGDQLVGQVGADDAGTDDHHTRAAHDRLLLFLDERSTDTQRKTTVLEPLRSTRRWPCQRTARDSASASASRPTVASASGSKVWSTRMISCSMIGPSSSSGVT